MIINARVGQLSNRIILIAHGLATAIGRGVSVRITEMDDLRSSYACDVTWSGRVDVRRSRFWALERWLCSAVAKITGKPFSFPGIVSDWSYRDYVGVEKFHDEIVRFFTPRPETIRYAQTFEREHFAVGVTRIGVHLRRGDYRQWRNGAYYFEDNVYARNMRSVVQVLPGRKLFVLFSNEPLDLSHFRIDGADVVVSQGGALDDHYLMSKCDYLMGPPSTFSRWGAYVGRCPLAFIEDKVRTLELADFKYLSI